MSWIVDNSGRLIASNNEVQLVTEGRGDSKANAMWIDSSQEADSGTSVWRLQMTGGGGMWVGVATQDRFGPGYALKGLLYGGPGNLSDGGSLVQAKWAPSLTKGDTVDLKTIVTEDRVTVQFGRNGANLGVAFDLTGWSGAALRPVVSLARDGDSLTITKLPLSDFPLDPQERGPDDISGDWESEDGSYQLSVEGDERMCRLSARVANNILCSLKYNDQRGWCLDGGVISTQMLPPPHLQALERSVSSMLESISDISRSGPGLVLSTQAASHKFNRAPPPPPATKDNIHWMN